MNFQELVSVEKPEFYIDSAFHEATKASDLLRMKLEPVKYYGDKVAKSKELELKKILTVRTVLSSHLMRILTSFPKINDLPPFYYELMACTVDIGDVKKSLGGVNWAEKKVRDFTREYEMRIREGKTIKEVNECRRMFYGRVSSLIKQIKNELHFLEETRKIMKGYPTIKTSLYSVAIAGFPNVGKSTLLSKLTPAKPEIASYAFTTKGIMIGYSEISGRKVQFLDTPGTLNRFQKMNNIEKQAYLAIKYVADLIVYVYDFTEPYSLKEQETLFHLLAQLKKDIIVYSSKADVLGKRLDYQDFLKKNHAIADSGKLQELIEKKAIGYYKALKNEPL